METKDFGLYLRDVRKNKKLTMRQLDAYSGVSHSYISQIERGERGIPSPEILQKLSKPLSVSYEALMAAAGYYDEPISRLIYEVQYEEQTGGVAITYRFDSIEPTISEIEKIKRLDPSVKAFVWNEIKEIANKAGEKTQIDRNEIDLLGEIDIVTPEDLVKKYNFKIDGKEITEDEAKDFLTFVRMKRSLK